MPKCVCGECKAVKDPIIVRSENRRTIRILNNARIVVNIMKIDGCVKKNETACDWLFIPEGHTNVFVELKGSDVNHGLLQLETSIREFSKDKSFSYLITRVTHPQAKTSIQNAVFKFKTALGSMLKVGGPELEHTL